MSIKIKDYIKRAVSTALIVTTIFTSICSGNTVFNPIEAKASAGVSGDGNTGGGTSGMGSSNKYYAWLNAAQGYRMYIVGTDGKIASNIRDFIYSLPSDTKKPLPTTASTRFGTGKVRCNDSKSITECHLDNQTSTNCYAV